MVKVCDAIMGSGKSQSAIRYMDAHPEKKFIYISPYVDDGPIIQERCMSRPFVLPSHLPTYNFSKTEHCRNLLEHGKNVACTHELFKRYDASILETIQRQQYTLIIDEEVNVMEECNIHPQDLEMLMASGYIENGEDGDIVATDREYGGSFKDFIQILRTRKLHRCEDEDGAKYFYWQLPPDLLLAFEDVFILTYLFECQDIKYMLDISGIPYEHIFIRRTEDGGYGFSATPSYLPEYVSRLSSMIDIYEGENLNAIGKPTKPNECPLSMRWLARDNERTATLRKNLVNYFTNYTERAPAEEKMWATYSDAYQQKLSRRGYANGFLVFNKRGSNEYRHKKWLAYCVNLYMSPRAKNYYAKHNIIPDEGERALSTMIQWIWRSAIRDGKPIHIYIPSERMRNLLTDWIARVEADAVSGRWAQHGPDYEGVMSPAEAIAS